MKINAFGLAIIKHFETCRLDAYDDGTGKRTIGWGHLVATPPGSTPASITQEQADALLVQDVAKAEAAIAATIHVPLTNNQFSALVSLVFNIGIGNFVKGSLDEAINHGHHGAVLTMIEMYTHAGGKELQGLVRRRAVEAFLYSLPDVAEPSWTVEAGSGVEILQKAAQPGAVVVVMRQQ